MRRARVLVATTAIALGLAVAGCSTGGTPSASGSAERCTEAQINALLSGAGFQLPPLVAGTADTNTRSSGFSNSASCAGSVITAVSIVAPTRWSPTMSPR